MADFLVIGESAINTAMISRVERVVDDSGETGFFKIHAAGFAALVAFETPEAKAIAEQFGHGKWFEGWPKLRDAAKKKNADHRAAVEAGKKRQPMSFGR